MQCKSADCIVATVICEMHTCIDVSLNKGRSNAQYSMPFVKKQLQVTFKSDRESTALAV